MIEVFADRSDAGRKLAGKLMNRGLDDATVLAIPMGGVPVGYEVAEALHADFDLVIPRKLPIPWNPEAGFGAVTIDGNIFLNRPLMKSLGLTKQQIEVVCEMVRIEIERRDASLRHNRPAPNLTGRTAVIVDDGLASGYTMLAAIAYVRNLGATRVVAAVPVASSQAARLVEAEADELVTLTTSSQIPFAVADFYLNWRDLSVSDVSEYLHAA